MRQIVAESFRHGEARCIERSEMRQISAESFRHGEARCIERSEMRQISAESFRHGKGGKDILFCTRGWVLTYK